MVRGTWWAVAVQPVILSIGTLFAAFDLDLEPILNIMTFNKDKDKEELKELPPITEEEKE